MMLKEGKDYKLNPDNTLYIFYNGIWENIVLEGYQFKSIIAAGANGVTVKSYHKITDRTVVIKIWKPRTSNLSNYQTQFLNEVQKISQLDHPNIVTIHDGHILKCGLCLAIYKFVDGSTLKQWLTHNPLRTEKMRVCRTVLETVEYYQKKGVIHGDLHLENILINNDGDISIIDFGTSIFSRQNQSCDRELYFISTLVMTLLNEFDACNCNHFCFNSVKSKLKTKKDPLLNFKIEPILLTETMRKYIDIVELLTYVTSFSRSELVDLCDLTSKTRYLDINEFMADMLTKYIERPLYNTFFDAMIANIEENIFPSFIEDYKRANMVYQASAAAYYELSKINDPKFKNLISLEIINLANENSGILTSAEYDSLILEIHKLISKSNLKTYFEIFPEIQSILKCNYHEVQESIRSVLFYSLQAYFKEPLMFPYWINTRANEILCNEEFLEKIEVAIYLGES